MDKKDISSNGQGIDKLDAKPIEVPQNNGAKSKTGGKSNTKPNRGKVNSAKKKMDQATLTSITQIAVAIIGVIGAIAAAWLSYQASLPKPTPTVIITSAPTSSSMPFFTDTAMVLTDTPVSTILPSLTNTITVTAIPSETMTLIPQPKLIVLLTVNKSSGKAPLRVKFDARESYLTDYDGQRYVCQNGPCNYIWRVYSNGQQLGKSKTDSGGTLDYSFGKKGTYTVSVWICRGQDRIDCGGSSLQITVI